MWKWVSLERAQGSRAFSGALPDRHLRCRDGNGTQAAVTEKVIEVMPAEAFCADRPAFDGGGGLFALRLTNGERVWYTRPQCGWVGDCSPAQMAVTHIPGIAFSGSVDGHLRAYSSDYGRIMWNENMARDYATGPEPVVAGAWFV
jgi:hypothetical protein